MKTKFIANPVSWLAKTVATMGPRWAFTRAKFALSGQCGYLERKMPRRLWSELPLSSVVAVGIPSEAQTYCHWRAAHRPRFLFDARSMQEGDFIGEGAVAAADRILRGEFPYFGYTRELGFPPSWNRNPIRNEAMPKCHWSKIDEFAAGDIKLCWEASRFGWAYTLSRAYLRTRDDKYPEAFWELFEGWLEENPPNLGIQWKCGQEVAFRTMALCFALYSFEMSSASTPARIERFVAALAAHGRRIAAHIEYAISQRNNHGISEATGLWTIGLLFPEIEGARVWKKRAKQTLEDEVRRQIYEDGGYVQHSANYHRLMLHDMAWAIRLGELNGEPFDENVRESFRKAVRFLHAITNGDSGFAPNFGGNDGALVLPLSDCSYPDMRPVLQSCSLLASGQPLYAAGPWDEEAAWINGTEWRTEPRRGSADAEELDAPVGGCYTIRSETSWAMLRAAKFGDRPAHADQLHLDLWWKGENLLSDAGTYSYNGEAPFGDGFASARYHNTLTIDGQDQMTRLRRFLWADWADAEVLRCSQPKGLRGLEGWHHGYRKLGVCHRRAVACADSSTWIIVDDVSGEGRHAMRQYWLMPDVPFNLLSNETLDLSCRAGTARFHFFSSGNCTCSIVRGGRRLCGDSDCDATTYGWTSRYYARKDPALSVELFANDILPVRFISVAMLENTVPVEVSSEFDRVAIGSKEYFLSAVGCAPMFEQEAQ